MSEWVLVGKYSSRIQAEMMTGLLESEGIPTVAQIDDAGGLRPELVFGLGYARVLVRAEDVDRAREILEHGGDGED